MPAYEIEDLNSAVKRVLAGETTRSVSDSTSIPYRTLTKCVAKGKMGIFRAAVRRRPALLLSQPAAACLVEWIVGRQLVGHPASRKDVIFKAGAVSSMATGQTVGGGWYHRFMERHPMLATRTSQAVCKARNAVTKSDLERFFSPLIKASN